MAVTIPFGRSPIATRADSCSIGPEESDVPVERACPLPRVVGIGHQADGDDVPGLLAEDLAVILEQVASIGTPLADASGTAVDYDRAHTVGVRIHDDCA